MTFPGLIRPRYDVRGLAGVLPRVAASLGVRLADSLPGHLLPPARRAVVVLVDGLGWDQLRARAGHAPFLRRALAGTAHLAESLTAGFPSTTATSMGGFGTGRGPGGHGLVGYQLRIPGESRVFNELTWQGGPDPLEWQPDSTVFERVGAAGVHVTMVGPAHFDGSGLTSAALRGARFKGAQELSDRVDASVAALQAAPPKDAALVYLYWGEVDKAGHVHGCDSWQWGDEVELLDRQLGRLYAALPKGTSLSITADHGMVDIPADARLDVAHEPDLRAGVHLVGGELRAPYVYCRPGADEAVLEAWRERLSDVAWVMSREQAVDEGLFGPVLDRVLPRIGEVVVAMNAPFGVFDTRVMTARVADLVGHHGSLTSAEQLVPFIHFAPK